MNKSKTKARCASKLDAEIGFRIRQIRQHRKQSQQTLAVACGVSRQQLVKYELGKDRLSVEKLLQIAAFLNVDVQDILRPVMDKQLPVPSKGFALENLDHSAARLWGKLKGPREKRVIVELMDLLHRQEQMQPPGTRKAS